MHYLMTNFLDSVAAWKSRLDRRFCVQLVSILIAGLMALLPVILFVHLYIDDYGRSSGGVFNWDRVGRPLADVVFYVVNYGRPGVAVSPLYTILSIFIYSLPGVLMVRAYGYRSLFWSALVILPLFAQPYGLENLSYGFDSVFMSLSVALAIIAAIVVQLSASRFGLVGGFLLLEASLCMYQPGASGFIPVAGFMVIASQLRLLVGNLAGMTLRMRLLRSFVTYGASLLGYQVLVSMTYERWSGYGRGASKMINISSIFSTEFIARLIEPWAQVASDFWLPSLLTVITFLIVFYVIFVFLREFHM